MFEQVKDYKSACKVLGIKPIDKRRKLEEHVLLYIQLVLLLKQLTLLLMVINHGHQSINKMNVLAHGIIGSTLNGKGLQMVLLQAYSVWLLAMALMVLTVIQMLIYDSLV